MAFPVPNHLPKRPVPVDVSSKILYKIDAATNETLNAALASSWIHELDESIQSTKRSVHERIHSDLPGFEGLLHSSKHVQAQFQDLTSRVNRLTDALSHPKTGVLPKLISTLHAHKAVAQDASDAEAVYESFSYLSRLRHNYSSLIALSQCGDLPAATKKAVEVDSLIQHAPPSLQNATIMEDLKTKFRATKSRVEDQLSDSYCKGVSITPTEFTIRPKVQVRETGNTLSLSSVIESLPPAALSNHLTTFRRDLLTHFVDHLLRQPYALEYYSSLDEEKLLLIPSPPNTEDLTSRLKNLSKVLYFLRNNALSHFPSSESLKFTRSLSKAVTNSVLDNLLSLSLPSSFGILPSFLVLLKNAVAFERDEISALLAGDVHDQPIKTWSDGVSGHYERRRRVEILEQARKEILLKGDFDETFQAVSNDSIETSLPSVALVQDDTPIEEDAWGFDEPMSANPSTPTQKDQADGWGFDDDAGVEEEVETEDSSQVEPETNGEAEPDPADAWGWNDDDLPVEDISLADDTEGTAWDDPWSDPPAETVAEPEVPKPSPSTVTSPRAATRLEKLASKHKKTTNGTHTQSPIASPSIPHIPQTAEVTRNGHHPEHNLQPPPAPKTIPAKRPADVLTTTVAEREYYQVPKQIKRIVKNVEKIIDESKLFYASNLFPDSKHSNPAPGAILAQSTSSIIDLYEALYPIKYAAELKSPDRGMLFANGCLYMAGSIQRIEDTLYGESTLKDRLTESRKHLEVLANSWFDDVIEAQQQHIDQMLVDRAQGFTYTTDQDRYDECEMAISQVVTDIKKLAHRLNGILARSKYYLVIGQVTEAALSRILQDILAISDIPEVESRRLAELCRILNSLEGLFSEDVNQPSFVVAYVPSWLKFSYLSELLEASLADIAYLFEQGALVDFRVDEIVSLVRALFADTQLRTSTINKILAGHPSM